VHLNRSKLLAPLIVLLLTIVAIASVWVLVSRGKNSREAQLQVSTMKVALANLQGAPFDADPRSGASPANIHVAIHLYEERLEHGLSTRVQPKVPAAMLRRGQANLRAIEPIVQHIYRIAVAPSGLRGAGSLVPKLQGVLSARARRLEDVLEEIEDADYRRASHARTQIELGATAAMILLLLSFGFFYFRSLAARAAVERLACEKEQLLKEAQAEARTDALTALGNRRALVDDLTSATIEPSDNGEELLLAMFDLDGFKQYNDSFGHAAGDALLQRLGRRLINATEQAGSAYRMGGDEFCVLARCTHDVADHLLDDAIDALRDSGEGWHIGCTHGAVWIPREAATASDSLKLADERMYANKAGTSSASRQVTDALLQVIAEQSLDLDQHVERVATLASEMAEALDQPEHEVWRIRMAATLHDIGKTAIPAAILDKPGPLDDSEWEFVRRHPVIGERIVLAAPALAGTAPLIRSSHERVDGGGYPDGLTRKDIPLGARIIAVCDAFDAMSSDRAYRRAMSTEAALEELRENAGTQFDADIVEAFCAAFSLDAAHS
jgi:diguanylate cyclase (GGDEF)-like protein